MPETKENRLRRLIHRSSYTGTKETDQLLGAFAREQLPTLSDDELDHYEDLLKHGDPAIWAWVSGQDKPPADLRNLALDRLMTWCRQKTSPLGTPKK